MPRSTRTARTARGRILAVAGAAAALAGAGTAAAASASAATVPAVSAAGDTVRASGLAAASHQAAAVLTGTGSHVSPLTPAQHATTAATTAALVRHAPARHHHATRHHHAPARPYQMYDSVTPSAIPAGHPIATYADGAYAASPSQVTGHGPVTWIDTNGSDPSGATALDVEPGDATPVQAASWAAQRLNTHPHATAVIYTMRSDWAAAQAAVSTLPSWQQHHVRWWIADPTGIPHIIPGASATQWYWGTSYDISNVSPGF